MNLRPTRHVALLFLIGRTAQYVLRACNPVRHVNAQTQNNEDQRSNYAISGTRMGCIVGFLESFGGEVCVDLSGH